MKRLISSIFLLVALGFVFTTADAVANTYTVTTSVCNEHGSIQPHHPAPTGQEYPLLSVFEMFIYPSPGYRVLYVHINDVPTQTETTPTGELVIYRVVNEDLHIDVCFESDVDWYQVTFTSEGDGQIEPPLTGPNTQVVSSIARRHPAAASVVYTVKAAAKNHIKSVTLDGVPENVLDTTLHVVTIPNIDANHVIHAVFEEDIVVPPPPPVDTFDVEIIHHFLKDAVTGLGSTPSVGITRHKKGETIRISFALPGEGWVVYKIDVNGETKFQWTEENILASNPYTITNSIGMDYEVEITFDQIDGIPTIEIPSLKISPNPVNTGIATISKDEDVIFTHIDIVDAMGNVVMTIDNPSNTINLSALAQGNYFVRFHTAKGTAIRSIIKN